jgi:hypothetical protein
MIQVEKSVILEAMRSVLPGVEKGTSGIEGANLFLFKNDRLFTYNGVTSVSVPFPLNGMKFGVNASNLFSFISKLNEMQVSIDFVMDKEDAEKIKSVKIFSGKTKASFALSNTEEIEKYLEGITFVEGKTCPENFSEAFGLTIIKDNIHPEMKGVVTTKFEDKMLLAASDKRRISIHELDAPMDEFKVDDDILADALKLGNPKTYSIIGPWLHLGFENDVTFSCIRQDLSKFNANAMIEAIKKLSAIDPVIVGKLPQELSNAILRVSPLASAANTNTGLIVKLIFGAEGVTAYAEKRDGNAEEFIAWDTEVQFNCENEVETWVSASILLEAGNKVTDFRVVCPNPADKSYVFLFTGEKYKALVGGVSIKD